MGSATALELQAFLDAWARDRLGSPIADVRFRAGRIDVVWGVELADGRAVVIKTHRLPVDLDAVRVAHDAQRLMVTAGFPCAVPLGGPDEVDRRVLTAETLVHGEALKGHDPVLAGTFDWELVADTEAVIAGFAAACYAASSTGGGGLSTPDDVAAFLRDYDAVRAQPLSARERRMAAGAAAWILAFNARWQVALIEHGLCEEGTVPLVRDRGEEYLTLTW